ncbi:hypothetical protein FRUB_07270 [Fimbriiglobus ruber]|uniref:Uncharacterized protein n=1 Tax=Fimbriiglobus ruber TaxID=1908690 RepID=A0A225D971_9BACT|nr:hypothetical protein FRUB_07270 [Fimbriiglobus ruber]
MVVPAEGGGGLPAEDAEEEFGLDGFRARAGPGECLGPAVDRPRDRPCGANQEVAREGCDVRTPERNNRTAYELRRDEGSGPGAMGL